MISYDACFLEQFKHEYDYDRNFRLFYVSSYPLTKEDNGVRETIRE